MGYMRWDGNLNITQNTYKHLSPSMIYAIVFVSPCSPPSAAASSGDNISISPFSSILAFFNTSPFPSSWRISSSDLCCSPKIYPGGSSTISLLPTQRPQHSNSP